MEIKSIDELMVYLREHKGIHIESELQKQQLRNIGYYHGYKGYRFFRQSNHRFQYTDFDELLHVYQFDMNLKALLYLPLMQVETALKNDALEVILASAGSSKFTDVFAQCLNHHADFRRSDDAFRKTLAKELSFRNRIYGDLSRDYCKKQIVQHFYERDKPVPIWAIFELISLGEFGTLLSCANNTLNNRITAEIGINIAFAPPESRLLEKIVFLLKDLRNAVAHNDPVFDMRFSTARINIQISKLLIHETQIEAVPFDTIVDYVILLVYLMKCLRFPKVETENLVSSFRECCELFRAQIPFSLFSTIIHTETRNKLTQIDRFLTMTQ